MKYPQIKIHLGANVNMVTVDGRKFDRFHMEIGERKRFTRLVSQGWRQAHEAQPQRQRQAGKRR